MNLKQLQFQYDCINQVVFEGKLPNIKLNITLKERDYLGLCETLYSATSGFKYRTRIILSKPMIEMEAYTNKVNYVDELVRTLIHEMIHVWQAEKVKGTKASHLMVGHPKGLFDCFGELAYLNGLCYTSDLLT